MALKPTSNLVLVLSALVILGSAQETGNSKKEEFANNLSNCVASQPIDLCLRNTLEDLRSLMPVGIPELNLRPSEPLEIDNIQFKTRPGLGVNIESEFSNVVVRHLSTFITERISADLEQRTLFIRLRVPEVKIRGNYRVDGNVFVFQISGNGPFQATLSGVSGEGSAAIEPVGPPGNKKLSIKRTNIDFDIQGAHVQLDNLFNGRAPAVATTVNNFINQNSQLIINEVKPQIREQVTVLVESVMNDAFSKLPADEFLKKLPLPPAGSAPPLPPQAPLVTGGSSPNSGGNGGLVNIPRSNPPPPPAFVPSPPGRPLSSSVSRPLIRNRQRRRFGFLRRNGRQMVPVVIARRSRRT